MSTTTEAMNGGGKLRYGPSMIDAIYTSAVCWKVKVRIDGAREGVGASGGGFLHHSCRGVLSGLISRVCGRGVGRGLISCNNGRLLVLWISKNKMGNRMLYSPAVS